MKETDINFELIKKMFEMQDTLNEHTVPNWKKAELKWHRAIWLEAAEAVESTPWKWWKKGDMDFENFRVEMVDIWHFIMSQIWVTKKRIATEPQEYSHLFIKHEGIDDLDLTDMVEDLVSLVLEKKAPDKHYIVFIFANIWYKLGYTFDDLYKHYITKNTLNLFRQNNGYKDGTYIKMWGDVEDNVIAWKLAEQLEPTNDMNDKLYAELITAYSDINCSI